MDADRSGTVTMREFEEGLQAADVIIDRKAYMQLFKLTACVCVFAHTSRFATLCLSQVLSDTACLVVLKI